MPDTRFNLYCTCRIYVTPIFCFSGQLRVWLLVLKSSYIMVRFLFNPASPHSICPLKQKSLCLYGQLHVWRLVLKSSYIMVRFLFNPASPHSICPLKQKNSAFADNCTFGCTPYAFVNEIGGGVGYCPRVHYAYSIDRLAS